MAGGAGDGRERADLPGHQQRNRTDPAEAGRGYDERHPGGCVRQRNGRRVAEPEPVFQRRYAEPFPRGYRDGGKQRHQLAAERNHFGLYIYYHFCCDLVLQSGDEPDRAVQRAGDPADEPVPGEEAEGTPAGNDGNHQQNVFLRDGSAVQPGHSEELRHHGFIQHAAEGAADAVPADYAGVEHVHDPHECVHGDPEPAGGVHRIRVRAVPAVGRGDHLRDDDAVPAAAGRSERGVPEPGRHCSGIYLQQRVGAPDSGADDPSEGKAQRRGNPGGIFPGRADAEAGRGGLCL